MDKAQHGLDTLGGYFNPILQFLQNGFAEVNAPAGLIIALITVFVMQRWGQLWVITLVAAIVYALVDHFIPILQNNSALRLPNVTDVAFWQTLAARYVGLLIIIAMFFAVKSVLFGKKAAKG
ncbi:MAG: hypothetical protein JNJ73_14690 [Hyphomonadaceae bacterium]|nr:hypothetical protein [Hyphomonadaceae bacterium]